MKRRREWLQRAKNELGIRVEFDFKVSIPGAPNLMAISRLPDFGAPNGMLVFGQYDEIEHLTKQLLEAGYGFTVLGEPAPKQDFDLQSCKEMLIDWGWSGKAEYKPAWIPE